jgi:carbon monoxide dehydrogenase subunit G
MRAVTIEAHGEVMIRRSVEEVFDFLADPRNEPRWLPGAKSVTMTSDGEPGLGSTFVGEYAGVGRIALELVEFGRPSRVTFRGDSAIVRFDDAVQLAPAEGGTHLKAHMTTQPKGLSRPMEPMTGETLQAQFASGWDHLRRVLER